MIRRATDPAKASRVESTSTMQAQPRPRTHSVQPWPRPIAARNATSPAERWALSNLARTPMVSSDRGTHRRHMSVSAGQDGGLEARMGIENASQLAKDLDGIGVFGILQAGVAGVLRVGGGCRQLSRPRYAGIGLSQ